MSVIIIFVIAIILLQIYLFVKTYGLIGELKKVLSGKFSTGITIDDDVTVIKYKAEEKDNISKNIEDSINTYLKKNKGAVSDFNLIKDIVERNCDTLEAEISSQTPLPLYLGLMGTVAGIVIGLFYISFAGGFSNIQNVIDILMGDVAIAMIASFMGIGLTTFTLWKSKECKNIVESNKNQFYTWIQTNLLPVISKSAVSAITLLQQNLTRFNHTFMNTIDRLEEKLGDVGYVYESQIEILQKIEAIDVKKMATANVKVLAALDGSMSSLDHFAQYMSDVTEYLTAVRELNGKLDEHLERTETLGVVSDFYKQQMKEISLRQDAIKSAVLSVDDVTKSALATLRANSEQGLKSMQEAFVSQMMSMQEMISSQTEKLTSQMNQMPQVVKKLEDISEIPGKLDKLIERFEKSNANLAKQVRESVNSQQKLISKANIVASQSSSPSSTTMVGQSIEMNNGLIKWLIVGVLVLIALIGIANLSVNIMTLNSNGGESVEFTEVVASEDDANDSPTKSVENVRYKSGIEVTTKDSTSSVKKNNQPQDLGNTATPGSTNYPNTPKQPQSGPKAKTPELIK